MDAAGTVLVFSPADPTRASALADDLRRDTAVRTVAVVERTPDGTIRVPDDDGGFRGAATLGGGAIGALIGILGGPLGVLLGWSVGTLGGAAVDVSDHDDDDDGLAVLAKGIAAGATVVMAEVVDPSFPAEGRAAQWGATVVRIPTAQVIAEVDAARAAQDAAAAAARKERRAQHRDDFHAHVQRLFHQDAKN